MPEEADETVKELWSKGGLMCFDGEEEKLPIYGESDNLEHSFVELKFHPRKGAAKATVDLDNPSDSSRRRQIAAFDRE